MTTDVAAASAAAKAKTPRAPRIPAAKVTVLPDGLKPGDVRVTDVDGWVVLEIQWTSKTSTKKIKPEHEASLLAELKRREAERKSARKSA